MTIDIALTKGKVKEALDGTDDFIKTLARDLDSGSGSGKGTFNDRKVTGEKETTENGSSRIDPDKDNNEGTEKYFHEKRSGTELDNKLMNELEESGVKYNAADVIMITKTAEGKLVWLEKGNLSAGYQHILNHADEFATKGISSNQIPDFISSALSKGKIVGMQGTRPIYEVMYNGSLQRVAITVGSNGFIVGANPVSLP